MSDSVCELFGEPIAIFMDVVVILLLNVCGGTLLDKTMYGLPKSVCDPSVHLDVPSKCSIYVCVCQKLSPHLRAATQVFAFLMLFLCVIFSYYVVG